MAPSDFQLLIRRLQAEFEALQEENSSLRAGIHNTPKTAAGSSWTKAASIQTKAAKQDLFIPVTPKDPSRIPDIKLLPAAEMTDEGHIYDDERGLLNTNAEFDKPCTASSSKQGEVDQVGTDQLREDTEYKSISGSSDSSDLAPIATKNSSLLEHYAEVLHRSSRFGNELVETALYRLCMAAIIILDCAMIMWNCHYYSNQEAPLGPRVVAVTVCSLFTIDGVLRVNHNLRISSGLHHPGQDLFDFLCWTLMVFDEICLLSRGATFKFAWASIMRAFRVLRLFYAFRHIVKSVGASQLLREFDWLLKVLMSTSGWRTVFCVVFYIGVVFTICSIALTDGALYLECVDRTEEAEEQILCEYFGTLKDSFITLFKVTYGGIIWGDVLDSLHRLSIFYAWVFALFVLCYSILLVNTAVGAILRVCQESTDHQKQMDDLRNQAAKEDQEVRLMEQIFMEIDVNDNGAISRTEFELALRDPHMTSTLAVLQLYIFDLQAIFPLFDLNQSGEISLDEFVLGCMKLKGPARSLDVNELLVNIREISEALQVSGTMKRSSLADFTYSSKMSEFHDPRSLDKDWGREPSNISSGPSLRAAGLDDGKAQRQQSIPKSEMRALSLREMKHIPGLIEDALLEEKWTDMKTGVALTREQVTLYHFNHYCICAKTAPLGIYLDGLDMGNYELGEEITQYYPNQPDALPFAVGTVLENCSGRRVHVVVKHGCFKDNTYPVKVSGRHCGIPTSVAAPGALSFKEYISSEALKPRWFCSHWWGGEVLHFIKCCDEHAWRRRLAPGEAAYWICAYANRQYDISAEISEDPTLSSFCKAMELAEGMLLFLDSHGTPFRRIWCCYEMYLTIMSGRKPLDIITMRHHRETDTPVLLTDGQLPLETQMAKSERERHFPLHLLVQGMRADLKLGEATVASDKENILAAIRRESSKELGIDQANGALNAVFAEAAWIHALHKRVNVEDIDPPNPLSLPVLLSRDTRSKISFSFEMFPEVSNEDVLVFARGLSSFYKEIHLSFSNCTFITDRGMRDLSEHLPHHIEICRLDFLGCTSISSKGLACLAQGLPPGILNLRLDFAGCPEIDMAGVKYLADHLPTSIKRFYATFPGTQVNRNFRSIKELREACGSKVHLLDRAQKKIEELTSRKMIHAKNS